MYKVNKIIEICPYTIVCEFNTGILKKLDIYPILENQSHLNGIEKLLDKSIFGSARIGEMGEIYWKDIIKTATNDTWNYDISPEFIFHNGTTIQSI